MNNNEFYKCQFKSNNNFIYFIWYYNDLDGVLVNSDLEIITFQEIEHIQKYSSVNSIEFESEELIIFDYDLVLELLEKKKLDKEGVNVILDFINIFTDIANSLSASFNLYQELLDQNNDLYEKIFYACDLPSVNTSENKENPNWDHYEISVIKEILHLGMKLFNENRIIINN